MITTSTPDTWQSLQTDVASILQQCGFDAEVEKTVDTARGAVELDVYAEEIVKGRNYTIACECKHWKNRVPQTVIHSFRTVVSDIGANVGYIISLNGFQSGSFTASELTNLELVTWHEFQAAFEETWFENHFSLQVDEHLDPLMTFAEPFLPSWFGDLPEPDKEEYMALKRQYDLFGTVMQSFAPYSRLFGKEGVPSLPLVDRLEPHELLETIPSQILQEVAYRELLEHALEHGRTAIAKFLAIRDRNAKAK